MIVWTCTRQAHDLRKLREKKKKKKKTKLSTKSRSLNKCYNYLFVYKSIYGKGEFVRCLFCLVFIICVYSFRICMQREKNDVFYISSDALLNSAIWFACLNWNIIYVANSNHIFFSLVWHNYSYTLHVCGIC